MLVAVLGRLTPSCCYHDYDSSKTSFTTDGWIGQFYLLRNLSDSHVCLSSKNDAFVSSFCVRLCRFATQGATHQSFDEFQRFHLSNIKATSALLAHRRNFQLRLIILHFILFGFSILVVLCDCAILPSLEPQTQIHLLTQSYQLFMHHDDQIANQPRGSSLQSSAVIMPEGEASQAQNQAQGASRGASRGRRGRGRGGRGRGHHAGSTQGTQGQPASHTESSENPPTPTAAPSQQDAASSSNPSRSSRGGRGSRRGPRQGERGGARQSAPRAPQPGPTRRFGGHLTVEADETASDALSLSAEAPEFVPGQPVLPRV